CARGFPYQAVNRFNVW
nr:immunoglobulin heavy chain junction region [Macaca mulatta]MOX91622.1 immunoglobulin heavy chain junction region [Macaca mulatta]MOX91949.1 immunoglobulin heavy chain junction region [Macaca mulatta]MOX92228.1 immunoglobulin heavy chain junction region [Macaca mulatta]MOX92278.1 immunoglobulin heavy chain junction region [Macaca mulatta]